MSEPIDAAIGPCVCVVCLKTMKNCHRHKHCVRYPSPGFDLSAAGLLSIDFIVISQTPPSQVEEKRATEVAHLFLAFQINKSGLGILEREYFHFVYSLVFLLY
jgi:hypothetical protein